MSKTSECYSESRKKTQGSGPTLGCRILSGRWLLYRLLHFLSCLHLLQSSWSSESNSHILLCRRASVLAKAELCPRPRALPSCSSEQCWVPSRSPKASRPAGAYQATAAHPSGPPREGGPLPRISRLPGSADNRRWRQRMGAVKDLEGRVCIREMDSWTEKV